MGSQLNHRLPSISVVYVILISFHARIDLLLLGIQVVLQPDTFTRIFLLVFFSIFSAFDSMFFYFVSTNSYKNMTIQRRDVEANGAIALQPVEAPDLVC